MSLWSRFVAWWRDLWSPPQRFEPPPVERKVVTPPWYAGYPFPPNGRSIRTMLIHKLVPTGLTVKADCGRIKPFPLGGMVRFTGTQPGIPMDEVARTNIPPDRACPRCFPDISERGWK